ncbi:MAG: rhombosortase [Thalassotalea sp.]
MFTFNFANWPLAKNQVLPILSISLLAILAFVFEKSLLDPLVYHRSMILDGQLWRLFTGHFFHTNLNHLLLNLAGLWLLWSLHGHYYNEQNYLLLFVFSALVVSLGLLVFSPNLEQYVGLSGILHGVFIWGAIKDIQHKIKSGYLLLFAAIAKIAHEQYFGASEDIALLINANVAIDAHLWGAIAGALFFIFTAIVKRRIN